jgi:hypothetical protein
MVQTKLPRVAVAPTSLALKLLVVFSSVCVGLNPSTMSWHSFFKSSWKTWLLPWRPSVQWFVWGHYKMSLCFPDAPLILAFSPYDIVVCRLHLTFLLGCMSFRGYAYSIILAWSRNSTVGQPFSGSGQLLRAPSVTLSLFLWLSAALYGLMPVSILVFQCSDSFHQGLFLMGHLAALLWPSAFLDWPPDPLCPFC